MTIDAGLEYHALLPLAWQDGPPAPHQVTEWMHENVIAFNAFTALEGSSHEYELDRTTNVDYTTARLDAKMDLLMQWMAKLLLAQQPLPPTTAVILSAKSINWKCPFEFTPGQFGVISLYLAPHLPMPLVFPVQIQHCADGQVQARLQQLSEEAQDGLERTLFRHHRRALHARSGRI